jgi:tRNA nucleotidyltransferase (CCA-adding enzyme)
MCIRHSQHSNIHRSIALDAAALVRLLERCDALRKPARFGQILLACECDARGRLGYFDAAYPQRPHLQAVLLAAQGIDTHKVASDAMAGGAKGQEIAKVMQAARVAAVQAALASRRQSA